MASDEDLSQAQGQDAGKESDPVPQRDVENDPEPDPEAIGARRIGECRPRGAFEQPLYEFHATRVPLRCHLLTLTRLSMFVCIWLSCRIS